jgi:Ni,Fe-hydrogenase III component G
MINRKRSSLDMIKDDIIDFYDKKKWHFLTLNGVKLNEEETEIQWIFSMYGSTDENITMFYLSVKQDDIIPDLSEILPSATISQREIVDMFGIEVENSEKGLYLDEDSESMPLSSCGI